MKSLKVLNNYLPIFLSTLVLSLLLCLNVDAQENSSTFRLITPGLVAQGQTFTGTVVEETAEGPIPLKEGSQISVLGEIVEVGKKGKVEVPTCPDVTGTYPIGARVISIPGKPDAGTQASIFSNQITSIPLSPATNPVTEIWTTSDIIGPGKVITVKGTNLTSLADEVLIGTNGEEIALTELSSSFFESNYVAIDPDFPQGEYHFSALDEMGDIHISDDVSLYPTFEMSGPALKRVGQKGKITIKTNGDGVITVVGGLPTIELHPTSDMNVINSDFGTTYMFPTDGNEVINIPFTALQVGQYTVSADLHSECNLPDELLGEPVSVIPLPVETSFDHVNNETTVSTPVEIITDDGFPLANSPVEGVISNPVQPEHVSGITNEAGIVNMNTIIPGQISSNDILFHLINVTGYSLATIDGNQQDGNCQDGEAPANDENPVDDSMAEIFKQNKETWGNYQGICGTGLMEMARNHPQAYADFLKAEQGIEDMLNGIQDENQPGNQDEESLDDQMREIYESNKRTWGNYQGICGTALMEMARLYPDLYQDFLENERRIEEMLNANNNQDQNDENGNDSDQSSDLDDQMRQIYEDNKRTWGNYQGICGTGLMEMARNYPDLYQAFLEEEARIEQMLNGENNSNEDNNDSEQSGNLDDQMREIYESNKRTWGNYQGICGTALMEMARLYPGLYQDFLDTEQRIKDMLNGENDKNEKVNPDTDDDGIQDQEEIQGEHDGPRIEDERIMRAFESENVDVYHTITIRLGGREAGITRLGDHYIMTEEKSTAIDPETKTAVSFFDFTKGQIVEGELWTAIYLLSLGNSPLNLVSRIADSAESLGREYLDELMEEMKNDNSPSILVEISSEQLLLMHFTLSFEQAAMPQLGDHVRSASEHFDKALIAAENGDWLESWVELNKAELDMAMLALELWPGGSGAKGTVKGGKSAIKPMLEVTTNVGSKIDEVVDVLRTAARNEASQDLATKITRKADKIENIASQSSKVRKAFDIGSPRPSNFATAAKDRRSLENFFGAENVNTVGRRSPDNVLVVTATTADGKQVKQIWVRPEYSDYKDAFKDVRGNIQNGFDIDHLQSRARASQQGYGYVQIEMVNSDINRAWGRTMEKRTVKMGNAGHIEPGGTPDIRKIDQFQWWKLQGISPDKVKEKVAKAAGK